MMNRVENLKNGDFSWHSGLKASCGGMSGAAMIEFALFAPLLFTVVLFLVEIGYLFRCQQDLGVLSREAANLVYRNCIRESGGAPIDTCVHNSVSPVINSLADRTLQGHFDDHNGAVLITLYRWNVSAGQWQGTLLDTVWDHAVAGATQPASRLPATYTLTEFDNAKSMFVVAEVSYDYTPVALNRTIGVFLPRQLYRETVM